MTVGLQRWLEGSISDRMGDGLSRGNDFDPVWWTRRHLGVPESMSGP